MAVKDPALDGLIIEAAKAEFLEYGYRKGSLRRIGERAGITTGALYTRYESKDALFCALIRNFLAIVAKEVEPLQKQYLAARNHPTVETVMAAIQREEEFYLGVLSRYYDECVLFFCRSEGSSAEQMIQKMEMKKVQDTVAFIRSVTQRECNLDGIGFIISQRLPSYQKILHSGFTKEHAIECVKTLDEFDNAGWRRILEQIL